jgi:hypothetical protein
MIGMMIAVAYLVLAIWGLRLVELLILVIYPGIKTLEVVTSGESN